MNKESIEFNKENREAEQVSRGEKELGKGDFSKAYYYFVRDNDIEGLYRLANILLEKGQREKAADVLAKVHQLANPENKA